MSLGALQLFASGAAADRGAAVGRLVAIARDVADVLTAVVARCAAVLTAVVARCAAVLTAVVANCAAVSSCAVLVKSAPDERCTNVTMYVSR